MEECIVLCYKKSEPSKIFLQISFVEKDWLSFIQKFFKNREDSEDYYFEVRDKKTNEILYKYEFKNGFIYDFNKDKISNLEKYTMYIYKVNNDKKYIFKKIVYKELLLEEMRVCVLKILKNFNIFLEDIIVRFYDSNDRYVGSFRDNNFFIEQIVPNNISLKKWNDVISSYKNYFNKFDGSVMVKGYLKNNPNWVAYCKKCMKDDWLDYVQSFLDYEMEDAHNYYFEIFYYKDNKILCKYDIEKGINYDINFKISKDYNQRIMYVYYVEENKETKIFESIINLDLIEVEIKEKIKLFGNNFNKEKLLFRFYDLDDEYKKSYKNNNFFREKKYPKEIYLYEDIISSL